MKRLSLLMVFSAFVAMACVAAEDEKKETKEPAKLVQLREQYQRAVVQAVVPLKQKYMEQLKALLAELTKAGKLDEAVAVQAAVKSMEEELSDDVVPAKLSTMKFKIISAKFGGVGADKKWVNVTEEIRKLVKNDSLTLPTNGSWINSPPRLPDPGVGRIPHLLVIKYEHKGKVKEETFQEANEFTIP